MPRLFLIRNAAGLLFLVASAGTALAQAASGSSFNDDLNPLQTRRWAVSNGWSNGGSFDCVFRGSNVVSKDGGTALIRSGIGSTAACAEVVSKQQFRFGTFEARVKPAVGSGLQTGFFLYARATEKHPAQEINSGVLGRAAEDKFVDLAIVWNEHQFSIYQDGALIRQLKAEEGVVPQEPMNIYLSLFSRKEDWIGPLDTTALPARAVFQRISYTAWGEPCQYPESIVCKHALTD